MNAILLNSEILVSTSSQCAANDRLTEDSMILYIQICSFELVSSFFFVLFDVYLLVMFGNIACMVLHCLFLLLQVMGHQCLQMNLNHHLHS